VGALAVWEASRRLQADGRFGSRPPRLHLSQNLPFAPMFRAWREGRRELLPQDFPEPGKEREIHATVLSTRSPPYSLAGGVYDALHQTGGRMYGITNREAREAQKLAEEVEGIDLDPAASVAVASLLQATEEGEVGREDLVLLNLTGGGYERIREDHPVHLLSPSLTLKEDTSLEEVEELLKEAHLAG
jgi:cysteate synthase